MFINTYQIFYFFDVHQLGALEYSRYSFLVMREPIRCFSKQRSFLHRKRFRWADETAVTEASIVSGRQYVPKQNWQWSDRESAYSFIGSHLKIDQYVASSMDCNLRCMLSSLHGNRLSPFHHPSLFAPSHSHQNNAQKISSKEHHRPFTRRSCQVIKQRILAPNNTANYKSMLGTTDFKASQKTVSPTEYC